VIDPRAIEELARRIDEGEAEARVIFARLRAFVSTLTAPAPVEIAPVVSVAPEVVATPPPPAPTPPPAAVVEEDQPSLFGDAELPVPESRDPVQSIYVHFERLEDIEAFGNAIGVHLGVNTRAITFPPDDMFRKTIPAPVLEAEAES